MTTPATLAEQTAPTRRNWLKRLGAVLGGTLLAGPALAGAARRSPTQVQSYNPFVGEIMLCAFGFPPKGFAMCNGQLLQISTNQALFSLLGTTYGGDGIRTFALPDLRGRVPRGQGQGPDGSYTMGQIGGAEAVSLTASQLPAHSHAASASAAPATSSSPVGNVPAVPTATNLNGEPVTVLAYGPATEAGMATTSTGASTGVPVLAPYLALNYCIALQGIFPSRN